MMAALPKQGPVEVSDMSLNISEQVKMAAMTQMEQQQTVPPKAVYPPTSSALSQVAASSNMAPVPMVKTAPVSVAKTNPMQVQGINRMRLAHERGDHLPTVEEAVQARVKAALYKGDMTDPSQQPQQVAKAKHPGYVAAGYVDTAKRNRTVPRQPVMVNLCDNIPEGDEAGNGDQLPLRTEGAITDASKRQRSPGASQFHERLDDFDNHDWEEVEGPLPTVVYARILDPEGGATTVGVGPYARDAPEDARIAMANTHIPSDVMSYYEWGRTEIKFGKTMVGLSYYQVAHGVEEKFFYYRKWARSHLDKKSILGKDFLKYLAVKERYFGVEEDKLYLAAQARAQASRPTIPGTQKVRTYVAEDGIWNAGS